MKRLFVVFIGLLVLASCCTLNFTSRPKYVGVDQRAQHIYDEYIELSSYKHIVFNKKISIGFTHIKTFDVVGLCYRSPDFREIEIDIDYWNNINKLERLELLFHELGHCACGRNHDYGGLEPYPENDGKTYADTTPLEIPKLPRNPKFYDGCPSSMMYPRVIEARCVKEHYSEYTEELFDRCEAW